MNHLDVFLFLLSVLYSFESTPRVVHALISNLLGAIYYCYQNPSCFKIKNACALLFFFTTLCQKHFA